MNSKHLTLRTCFTLGPVAATARMQDSMSNLEERLLLLTSSYCKTIEHESRHFIWNSHIKIQARHLTTNAFMQLERILMKSCMQYFAMDMWETGSIDPVRISPLFSLSLLALSHVTRIGALRQLQSNSRVCGAFDPTYNPSHLHNADRPMETGHLQPIVC